MNVFIIIPAYNEAETIYEVVDSVLKYGNVLVVNDGSKDDTSKIAVSAGATVLNLKNNSGYEFALDEGFKQASKLGANIVITFDADGQLDPKILNSFIKPLLSDKADMVVGIRPRHARLSEYLFNLYIKIRFNVNDILCGIKAYKIYLYNDYGLFDHGFSVGTELAVYSLKKGVTFKQVSVQVSPRKSGTSRFGSIFTANFKIMRAFLYAISMDILN